MAIAIRLAGAKSLARAALAQMTCLALAACVDTQKDFDDYVGRTASARDRIFEAGALDGPASGTDLTGTFFGAFVPEIETVKVNRNVTFYTEVRHDVARKTLDVTMTPFVLGAATMSKSLTRGASFGGSGIPIADDGTFSVNAGSFRVEGDAQPINPGGLSIEQAVFNSVVLDSNDFCSELAGMVTAPLELPLTGQGDRIIYKRLADGSPLPMIPGEEGGTVSGYPCELYTCPLFAKDNCTP